VIEDVVGPRDVVVRLATSGICHTDVNVLDGLCPVVLLNAVGAGAMLAVVLGDPAVLGKVRYHVKKALPDLVRAV